MAAGTSSAAPGQPATQASSSEPMLEHADPIASYTLSAKLDPYAHTLHGTGTIAWKNATKQPISELWFHLYLNAFKNQLSVFMRAPIGGFRGNTVPSDWGAIDVKKLTLASGTARADLLGQLETQRTGDADETDARVPLPQPVEPGASITLEIEWDDKLPSIVERTGYHGSFHMLGQWFPKIARLEADGTFAHFPFHHLGEFYADFGTYDVTLDVPAGFVIGATGPAVETKDEGGRHIERHVQGDIHDFAWTAWDQWQTRKERISDVDVTVLTPPNYDDHAERELETMRFALPHYGARYGKYPYPVLTLVHPPAGAPEAGGMEYPTLITTGQPSWMPRGLHFVEGVTIHEFGHQYFYGLCASNEDAWPFLDEGLNSYAENDGMRAFKGAGSGIDFLGIKVGDVEAQSERARHVGHDERVAQGAGDFMTGSVYGSLVYSRTATILETLARAYGPEKMEMTLATYARRFRFLHPTPDDLIGVVRSVISSEAAENLRIALFEKGWVDYAITQISSHKSHSAAGMFDRDGKRETVSLDKTKRDNTYDGSILVVRRGTLKLPIDVTLIAEDGRETVVPWDGQSESMRIPYGGASPLRSAVIDRDEKILLDEHRENDFATASGQKSAGAPKTLERATWWAGAILGVWLFELACAYVLATPVHAWAKSVWGAHPDGDSVLFKPGGLALIDWLGADGPMLSIIVRTTFVLFVVFGLLSQVVSGALIAGLVTEKPRLVPALKSGLSAFFPLLAIAFLTAAIQGFFFGIGYYLSSSLDHAMQHAYGDQRAFVWRLVVFGLFFLIVLAVGVLGDLAKVTLARDIALGQTDRPIRNAIVTTVRVGRGAIGRACLGWGWRAIVALWLVGVGATLNDWEASRGGSVIWLLFVAHQALLFGRAALRTSWLANALRLVPVADQVV